ncbi:hypothetical protein EON83_03420 [bacterium]|nr:MAG: hypothetical protein EON83_03420 [bacterium]
MRRYNRRHDDMETATLPSEAVFRHFGVRLVEELGGRLNRHWQVERGNERFVLRLWAPVWVETMDYEVRLLERLAGLGWPVASIVGEPFEWDGYTWSLSRFLEGEPASLENPAKEQRRRGRLLAQLHEDLKTLDGFGQRGVWRRCEQILADETLDQLLSEHEARHSEGIGIIRWHLERARGRTAEMDLRNQSGMVIHGDFTHWNLRFSGGQLSGILDFELAHLDHRVGEFALAWRGKYDEVVLGYDEVAPLSEQEWQLLTPIWWAFLIEESCQALRRGEGLDEWSTKKLLQRSPLMGTDSAEFR